jgi:hypothetical protein
MPRTFLLLAAFTAGLMTIGRAQEKGTDPVSPDKERKEEHKKLRLELMKSAIDDLKIAPNANLPAPELKFGKSPLLRYNDETRGFLDAGVWRLGETGRPTALVTVELYRRQEGTAQLTYEFLSLTPARFSMATPQGMNWIAIGTDLKFTDVPDSPIPAKESKGRLPQMREIARRFSVHEELKGDKVECRLMPSPIDRYADASRGIVDGAMFAFANGTNPEVGALVECNDRTYSYGVFRLSSAALAADLDGKTVYEAPAVGSYSNSATYTSAWHVVSLPE